MSWQTLLRHIRYLWLRNPRNLTDHQTDRLSQLLGPWGQALSAEDWGAPTAGCSSSKGSTGARIAGPNGCASSLQFLTSHALSDLLHNGHLEFAVPERYPYCHLLVLDLPFREGRTIYAT